MSTIIFRSVSSIGQSCGQVIIFQNKALRGCGTYESVMHVIHFGKGSSTNAKSSSTIVHAVDFNQCNKGQGQSSQLFCPLTVVKVLNKNLNGKI